MKDDFNTDSSPEFVARLSKDERNVYKAFISVQTAPEITALLVFRGCYGVVMTAVTASPQDMAKHLKAITEDDVDTYNSLIIALNTKRSFESQWTRRPGSQDGLLSFLSRPLICVQGLENSPHNKLQLVHSTNQPQQPSDAKRPPNLRGIKGGLNF